MDETRAATLESLIKSLDYLASGYQNLLDGVPVRDFDERLAAVEYFREKWLTND